MALFTLDDVTAVLSPQAFARLAARSGGGTPDLTYANRIVAEVESTVRMITRAAFPAGLDAAGGTVDAAIVGACVDLWCELAASRHASAATEHAYMIAGKRARDFLKALNRGADAQPVTSAAGRAQPVAAVAETTDDAGTSTRVYGDLADRQSRSGY